MGGQSYDRDVGHSSSSGGFPTGRTSTRVAKEALGRTQVDPHTSAVNRIVHSDRRFPIILGLDVTGSNIEFARIVYDKAPMLHGQIEQKGYLDDFDICFSAIGDANTDFAPFQVCDFKSGIALDKELKKLYLEGKGGGQGMETYEVQAYYFTHFCEMPNAEMPLMFIIGDEAPYPSLSPKNVRETMGGSIRDSLDTKIVFAELLEKFKGNVFFLQNPYCGDRGDAAATDGVRRKWADYMGAANIGKIIPIYEEKSVVDVILGAIAIASGSRTLETYIEDMHNREQTETRVKNVKKSLGGLEAAFANNLWRNQPDDNSPQKHKSGARRF